MTVKKDVLMPLSVVALYLVSYNNCVAHNEYNESIWFDHSNKKFYVRVPKERKFSIFSQFVEFMKYLFIFKFKEKEVEKHKNCDREYDVEEIPLNVIIEDNRNRNFTLTYEV